VGPGSVSVVVEAGVVIYNAVMGAPDQLLSSTVAHLQEAYAVDVIGAIVVAQSAAPAMRAAGFGTIIVTGGGFADHPIPALATVSLGKAALRSAATMLGVDLGSDGIRVATLTIAGQIVAGTSFDPARIADRYWGRPDRRSLAGGIPLHRRVGEISAKGSFRPIRRDSSWRDCQRDADPTVS
jgi:NAD(P)-dependent dehydrogenase (short-subunit alcohol dehydrogenase family)